jgi:16S rRNA processing protein RimM
LQKLYIGLITKPWGIKGGVIVNSFCHPSSNIFNLKLFDEGENIILLSLKGSPNKSKFTCFVKDIDSIEKAESIRNTKIYTLTQRSEDELYVAEILGKPVLDEDEKVIGKLEHVYNFNAGDIFEIKFSCGKSEMYHRSLISFRGENIILLSQNVLEKDA